MENKLRRVCMEKKKYFTPLFDIEYIKNADLLSESLEDGDYGDVYIWD